MKIWNDFDIDSGEWIGIIMEIDDIWIYILNEDVHPWLKKFDDLFIGFQK